MSEAVVTDIEQIEAPYRRLVLLQDVAHESGLKLLRIRIREGTRFTILDLDAATAQRWAALMAQWAADNQSSAGDETDPSGPAE